MTFPFDYRTPKNGWALISKGNIQVLVDPLDKQEYEADDVLTLHQVADLWGTQIDNVRRAINIKTHECFEMKKIRYMKAAVALAPRRGAERQPLTEDHKAKISQAHKERPRRLTDAELIDADWIVGANPCN